MQTNYPQNGKRKSELRNFLCRHSASNTWFFPYMLTLLFRLFVSLFLFSCF